MPLLMLWWWAEGFAMADERTDHIKALYRQAFQQFGSIALWNMRPKQDPTPWRSPPRCARMAAWTGGGSPNASRSFAVPISRFQSEVLRHRGK